MKEFSNLSKIIIKRTYARDVAGTNRKETWEEIVDRVIEGNIGSYRNTDAVEEGEEERLRYYMLNRKALPAGRGLWFSGTEVQKEIGGLGLNNCSFFTIDSIKKFGIIQDYLMLGSGVGVSVQHKYVSKLPKVLKGVQATSLKTKDADFIVPDSREGWNKLTDKIFRAFFETGESFSYSTIVVRGAGEKLSKFGGVSSGDIPLIEGINKVVKILKAREGKHLRPIDVVDIVTAIGEIVVSGNIRRSAIIIIGDAWDKEYLMAKRFDLGAIPTQRAKANFSVACDDYRDLHPLFWETYQQGEPFGIINLKTIQKYARLGDEKRDNAVGINPCAEVPLADGEVCNLQEIFLPHLESQDEFNEAARLMFRWGKRVSLEHYHTPITDAIVKKNRRVGTSITGCMQSKLFSPQPLDEAYNTIAVEDKAYSKLLGVNESIRFTTIKPSGTLSKLGDVTAGIHPVISEYYIKRMRFGSNDSLIPLLKEAGHHIEPEIRFDGSLDYNTSVVSFYVHTPNTPTADDLTLEQQLDNLIMAQRYWADNSISITVYYRRNEVDRIKSWIEENLQNIKAISFLCLNDHGFVQAPEEAITKEEYEKAVEGLKSIDFDAISGEEELDSLECAEGVCPVK
jgi:ribonucleoside-triphosphate reductase (thioredoxin)